MTNPTTRGPTAAQFNSPEQRNRRKITRDIARTYFAICRAAGLEPNEARTAFAISTLCYDTAGKDYDAPRKLTLASIGAALTSTADDKEDKDARWKKAQRDVSHLFCQALPRVGLQLLARFKAVEDGKAHEYADHAMAVAGIVAELFDAERKAILSSDAKGKSAAIDAAMERLAREALVFFEPLDVLIVGPDHKPFAVVAASQAKAFCEQNPTYKAAEYKYTPPAEPAKNSSRPFAGEDLDRMIERDLAQVERHFWDIADRNTPEEARLYVANWLEKAKRRAASWVKVADAGAWDEKEEEEELIHVSENGGVRVEGDAGLPVENPTEDETATYDILSWVDRSNSFADNTGENEPLKAGPVENLSGSVNFDTSLEAATFHARDGFPVIPVCNSNPATGGCTADWHPETCRGRVPLIKGDGTPGYPQASKDLARIGKWFEQWPDAGVALRLDDHILIDADAKDGGPQSYQELADTFNLPETLSAITQSGDGRHYVFKLPEGLPDAWLKSWVRVGDKVELPGLDIKVDRGGLMFVEPTRGPKGVYRWIDPTVPPATLPREVCDFLHKARYIETPEEKAKAARRPAPVYVSPDAHQFDHDQSKYFRDVPNGERHRRLFDVGCSIRANTRASASRIAEALRYHAARFSDPLNDERYIRDTAARIERDY